MFNEYIIFMIIHFFCGHWYNLQCSSSELLFWLGITTVEVPTCTGTFYFQFEILMATTKRNANVFCHNGYVYQKERISGEKIIWKCERRGRCKARIHTHNGIVVHELHEHTHNVQHARLVQKVKLNHFFSSQYSGFLNSPSR